MTLAIGFSCFQSRDTSAISLDMDRVSPQSAALPGGALGTEIDVGRRGGGSQTLLQERAAAVPGTILPAEAEAQC